MQTIIVTMEVNVPDNATKQDITDWVDVNFGERNSMKRDNPCINDYEVEHVEWKPCQP